MRHEQELAIQTGIPITTNGVNQKLNTVGSAPVSVWPTTLGAMNTKQTLIDLADRAEVAVDSIPELSAAQLNAHPLGHPNSIAWMLWHTGRVLDALTTTMSGGDELWAAEYKDKFGLDANADATGVGQSAEEAESIVVEDQSLLVGYVKAGLNRWREYTASLEEADFDDIVGEFKGAPQSRQGRLTLALVDAIRHIDQVLYVAGMPEL